MIITPIPHGLDLLATDLVRSPGLHMSQIYNSLFTFLDPKRYGNNQPRPLMMALGTAWEHHLEFLLGKAGMSIIRPGELFTTEGIAYSPDGILTDRNPNHHRLIEYKLTWMSPKDLPTTQTNVFPAKFNKHLHQMMNYCFHLEMPRARLYLCCVNESIRQPELFVYDFEFTSQELQVAWDMSHNHAIHQGWLR